MNASESVVLDYTLYDLYSIGNDASQIYLVNAYAPPPNITATRSVSALVRFPVQAPLLENYDQRELMGNIFHVTAQRFGFCAGPMSVLVVNLAGKDKIEAARASSNVERVFEQIHCDQRPEIVSIDHPSDIEKLQNAELAVTVPLDWLVGFRHIIDPSIHYNLLSKRGLAESGLPTPETLVIDTVLSPSRVFTESDIQDEVIRMTEKIRNHSLPFILKVPRVASLGQGTFVVQTEAERLSVETLFRVEVKKMILALKPSNQDLHPCAIILQRMIPGDTAGITFFISKLGDVIFNCCTRQNIDATNCWSGGFISYDEQDTLKLQYQKLINEVGAYLFREGYFGPAGIDVMTDENGTQLVVDTNVRVTATYHLGALQGHFRRRGFVEAAALTNQRFNCAEEEFQQAFKKELINGSLLVTAWVPLQTSSFVTITVAEKDTESVERLIGRVLTFRERVTARVGQIPG